MPPPSTLSHARRAFAERLASRPLLLDGAMGTLLYSRGIPQRASLDELVEGHPDIVSSIHREYVTAGADIIETDTFGANRLRLAPYGLAERTARLNRRAAQLAREARDVAGRDVLVGGSVGPLTAPIRGPERPDDATMRAVVREQVEGLLEGGVDLLLIETASDLDELLLAIDEARALSDVPILGSMTFGEDLVAVDGTTPEAAARALAAAGVDGLGVNCGVGPVACLDALGQMAPDAGGTPLLIMPNAGLPSRVEGQFVYAAGPAYFAEAVPRFLAAGARLVGGCCGTTPEHVAAMRQALDKELARVRGTEAAIAGGETQLEVGASPRSTIVERAAAASPLEAPPPTRLATGSPRGGSSSAWRSTPRGRCASSAPSRPRASSRRRASTW